MANAVTTQVDIGSIVIDSNIDVRDGLITTAGADDYPAGTILAVDSVSGNFVAFVKGGVTNDDGIPKAVLQYDFSAAGAGDHPARPVIRGRFYKDKLIIDADGDSSNIDVGVRDDMQNFGLIVVDYNELTVENNTAV